MKKIILVLFILNILEISSQTIPINPISDKYPNIGHPLNTILIENYNNDSLYSLYNTYTDSIPHPQYFAFGKEQFRNVMEMQGWQEIEGYKVLRFAVYSDSSKGFKFKFNKFHLTNNAGIFIYPPNKQDIYGAYTHLNNRNSNTFITQEISYNYLIVEVNIPIAEFSFNEISIDEIVYIYQSPKYHFLNLVGFGKSDECIPNVNCYPHGNEYCKELRSVVKLELAKRSNPTTHAHEPSVSHYNRCSGTLMNNKSGNLSPFILTAHHCIDIDCKGGSIEDFLEFGVVTFNFQSANCLTSTGANDKMTLVGLQGIESKGCRDGGTFGIGCPLSLYCPDIKLLKITDNMRWDYNVYFSGWNISTDINDYSDPYVVGIHHPFGDIKKYSKGVAHNKAGNDCWQTDCWRVDFINGGVSKGSSGSPLFGNDHKVMGVLSGGDDLKSSSSVNSCNDKQDVSIANAYGKVGEAWDKIGTHLSPGYPDEHDLIGIDPFEACIPEIKIFGQLYPGNDYQLKNEIIVQAASRILIADNNIPTLIDGSGIPGNTINKCNYVFSANDLIRINQGFSIKAGNTMSLRLQPCAAFIDCGFNYQARSIPKDKNGSFSEFNKYSESVKSVNLYPSPTSNILNLDTKGIEGINKIIITNTLGQVLFNDNNTFNSDFTNTQINTSKYANGIYFLEIINADGKVINIQKFSVLQ